LVDAGAGLAEVAGSIDVGAAVIGHGEKHHAVAVNVAGFDEGLLVGFPDAVDDRRLPRIGGGAMIEFAAQVDHSHGACLPRFAMRPRSIQLYRIIPDDATTPAASALDRRVHAPARLRSMTRRKPGSPATRACRETPSSSAARPWRSGNR